MNKDITPTQVVYWLLGIIVLLIICFTATVLSFIDRAYSYELPQSEIENINTNVGGNVK